MYKQADLSFSVAATAYGNNVTDIQFSTQDKNTAKLVFTIKDKKEPLNLTDVDGEVTLVMQDKSRFVGKAEVTEPLNGKLEYTITPEQIRHAGQVQGEITLKKEGSSIGGFRFNFKIKKALIDEDLGPVKEFYIEDLEAVKQEVKKKADAVVLEIDTFKEDIDSRTAAIEEQLESLDENVAESTVLQVETAKGTHATLDERIKSDVGKLTTQLAEKAGESEILETRLSMDQPTKIISRNYSFYQAIIEPPISGLTYQNAAISIYASFQKGECLSENHLKIYDESGNEIPFQIEYTKDAKTGLDLGKYPDNSLKFVTIWILQTITTRKTLTVKVFDQPQSNNFPELVRYTSVSSTREEFQIGTSALAFEASPLWQARRVIINGQDMNTNVELSRATIVDSELADLNLASPATGTFIEKTNTGNGVVFREHVTRFKATYHDGIEITQRSRLYANNRIEIETFFNITKDLPSGVFGGFLAKLNWTPLSNATNIHNSQHCYAAQEMDDIQILAGVHDLQVLSPKLTAGYPTSADVSSNNGRVQIGMKASSKNAIIPIPAGAFLSVRQYLSFNYGKSTTTVSVPESFIRMNPIATRMTNFTAEELKRRFIGLSKRHIENLYHWDSIYGGNQFYGLQGMESLAAQRLLGYNDKLSEAITRMNKGLTTYYSGGTKTGFYNAWLNGRGIEYIGREMAILEPLLHTKERDRAIQLTHNLADAFIDMEVTSGGEGKMSLRGTNLSLDNLNAEATAVKYLALSLSLSENQTRRNCMNRIIDRFLSSIEFVNHAPYSKAVDGARRNSITQPTMHYHAFCYFDFFDAVRRLNLTGLSLPSIRQYAMVGTNAAGQIKEVGYQYNPERRGSALTNIYIAGCLVRFGENISDLEHACQLLEHVISKALPSGHHEHPIDGWGMSVGPPEASSAIEAQVLIETVYGLLTH